MDCKHPEELCSVLPSVGGHGLPKMANISSCCVTLVCLCEWFCRTNIVLVYRHLTNPELNWENRHLGVFFQWKERIYSVIVFDIHSFACFASYVYKMKGFCKCFSLFFPQSPAKDLPTSPKPSYMDTWRAAAKQRNVTIQKYTNRNLRQHTSMLWMNDEFTCNFYYLFLKETIENIYY